MSMILGALNDEFDINVVYTWERNGKKQYPKYFLLRFSRIIYFFIKYHPDTDILISDILSAFFLRRHKKTKYICLFHHLDFRERYSFKVLLWKLMSYIGIRKQDIVVSVSEYWKKKAESMGAKKVEVIYNAFNIDRFSNLDCRQFIRKYTIPLDKPLIYIGINSADKGIIDVYEILKEYNYTLVSSGTKNTDVDCIHLDLTYDDYLCLLASCSVAIIMTKIPEGWNRNAHEAMLMKTPVIGSGSAGMRELLEQGGQVICEDISRLPEILTQVISDPANKSNISTNGYDFAKNFTKEKFRDRWINLMYQILN